MGEVLLGSTADAGLITRTARDGGALMLHVSVPAGEHLWLEHLVLDVNGTLTDRGRPIEPAARVLAALGGELALHVLSPTRSEPPRTLHVRKRWRCSSTGAL